MLDAKPFTPDGLADRWNCSAEHVRELIRSGQLPAFRIGKLYRIRADDIAAFEQAPLEDRV